MPQDAFTLRRGIQELSAALVGGKINKIVQPNKDDVLLYIYTGKELLKLVLSTNASSARVCLTTREETPPAVAPNFCMLLRKHLLGAEIKSVGQVGFERIVEITLRCVSDFSCADRILYVEVMGKYSNAVLTEKGIILGALKTTALEESSRRVLFPGAKYLLPPPQDKADPSDPAALSDGMSGFEDAADRANYLFTRLSGLAYATAAQIAAEYERRTNKRQSATEFVREYLFEGETYPCLLTENGEPKEFGAKYLDGSEKRDSLQAAQDELYGYHAQKKEFTEKKRRLTAAAKNRQKKQEKKISQIDDKLSECENAEDYRIKGELITANIYRLERGMSECKLLNYYDPEGKEIKIVLDRTLSPARNAQKYYKRYAKLKRTVEALTPLRKAEEEELFYTNSILSSLSLAKESLDLTEIEEELIAAGICKPQQTKSGKKAIEPPFRTFEKDGFTILAGRNNVQNDRLLRSVAPHDLWFHAQKYHSSHVAVLTNGREVPNDVLLFAAAVCARYSDGKNGTKIPVDYCQRRFVKKPSKSKAGFVVYTDYKTLLVDPLPKD